MRLLSASLVRIALRLRVRRSLSIVSCLPGAVVTLKGCLLLFPGLFASGSQSSLCLGIAGHLLPGISPLFDRRLISRARCFGDFAGNAGFILGEEIIAFGDPNLVAGGGSAGGTSRAGIARSRLIRVAGGSVAVGRLGVTTTD